MMMMMMMMIADIPSRQRLRSSLCEDLLFLLSDCLLLGVAPSLSPALAHGTT